MIHSQDLHKYLQKYQDIERKFFMIARTDIFNINFYKKERFHGSYKGMHYRIEKYAPEEGDTVLQVIHTPGHTPGHVALYEPVSKSLFTGDTLFRESIGRTDLPGGDYSWIMRSILDSLIPLGEEVHIYPGHGPESTIGHETLYNPFIVEVLNEEVNYRN